MQKFFALTLGAALLATVSTAALADGMPRAKAPAPILTPLTQDVPADQPPVDMSAPPVVVVPEDMAAAVPPPPAVPDSRIVEVQENTAFFGLSIGAYSPFTHRSNANGALNLEYQTGTKIAGYIQPIFGGMASGDGTLLGYAALGAPIRLGSKVFMMPSLGVGAYKKGGGYDLDRTLVYRLGGEIAYVFDNQSRLGLTGALIGNGKSMNREDFVETIMLTYTTPLNALSGK